MKIITGFETEPIAEGTDDRVELNDEFFKVFQALEHDQEVAENVFARASKKAFKAYCDGGSFTEAKDARDLRPVWVTESSVVLPVKGFDDAARSAMAAELQDLVHCLGEAFRVTAKLPHVALIDPLKCRIQAVGEQDYKFTLKQMWAPK